MTVDLSTLIDAIQQDLGEPLYSAFPEGFFERALNEGQSRYEPDLFTRVTLTDVELAVDDIDFELPDDAIDPADIIWLPDSDQRGALPSYVQVDQTLVFKFPICRNAWTGRLVYKAHFPEITEGQPCRLPKAAADGLISFALYRAFRRIAAGRAEYRRYATIVGNGVAMADIEQAASIHLQDFEEGRVSAIGLAEPTSSWE